jgi:hypothetical protein
VKSLFAYVGAVAVCAVFVAGSVALLVYARWGRIQ